MDPRMSGSDLEPNGSLLGGQFPQLGESKETLILSAETSLLRNKVGRHLALDR